MKLKVGDLVKVKIFNLFFDREEFGIVLEEPTYTEYYTSFGRAMLTDGETIMFREDDLEEIVPCEGNSYHTDVL